MTLGRLVVAWLAVAAWTMVATVAVPLLVATLSKPVEQTGVLTQVPGSLLKWCLFEALVLTLLATLWFDSLGSGGWWLVFLLIGVLAIGPKWLSVFDRADRPRRIATVVGAGGDLARYVVAGAILAWLLR